MLVGNFDFNYVETPNNMSHFCTLISLSLLRPFKIKEL